MKNGTNSIASLTARDVCDILRVCKETQVVSLEFSGLIVKFTIEDKKDESVSYSLEEPRALEKELFDREKMIKEDQLAQMAITDPVQYEELMRMEMLEDVRDDKQENGII